MKTWVVEITPAGKSEADLAAGLRLGVPPVVVRIQQGKLLLDPRTIFADQETELIDALRRLQT